MQGIALPPMDRRLQKRYAMLVDSQLHPVNKLAAGVASLPSAGSAFAATQATAILQQPTSDLRGARGATACYGTPAAGNEPAKFALAGA
jgi:hypothetical protein